MKKPIIQIGDEIREMTDSEFTQWQIDNETAETAKQAALAQIEIRQSALEKLIALGLTADEIAALVG